MTTVIPQFLEHSTCSTKGKTESERAKLVRQQERKLRLANDKTAGTLISRDDASAVFTEYCSAIRAGLTAMPGRLSSQIAGMTKQNEIQQLIKNEIDEFLTAAKAVLTKIEKEDPTTRETHHGDLH